MKIMMWSPLPDERSGISDYTYELLESMAQIADVTAVSRYPDKAQVPPGVALIGPEQAKNADATHIYQMGNNTQFHEWIYEQALAVPGLVVLHDPSLLDFNLSYFGGLDSPDFMEEMRYAHGPIWGDRHDPATVLGYPGIEADGLTHVDRMTMTMERRIVSASLGVLVHDPFRAAWLRERYPDKPIFTVSSGAPLIEDDGTIRSATRAKLGWRDDHVVFGVFGGFTAIKRIRVVVLAFAQVRRRWPQARLLIVGHAREKEIVADTEQAIEQLGLADSVLVVPGPDKDEFQNLIVASDALIGLRWPTAGETSAVMMRTYGAGRLFITTDLPQHRHFDRSFCWLVPVDPAAEAQQLAEFLEHVVCWPEEAHAAGKLARDYVRERASWPVIAETYLSAARTAPSWQPSPAADRPGVNIFGDARADTDHAESARRRAIALALSDVDTTFTEFNSRATNRHVPMPRELGDLRRGKDYPIDLWMVNHGEFGLVGSHALDRYTIALWTDADISGDALAQLSRVDELWVPSAFVADVFRPLTDVPVTVIPEVVAHKEVSGEFTLPSDGPIVLADFGESVERRNALAAVEAFRLAFPQGTGAHLVINGVDAPDELRHAVADVNGTLLNTTNKALYAASDIYLSLHRSTGFGLDMAEAMALGKPVIATGYGGNTDFMPPGSAVLVGYTVHPGAAEPDIAQAANWLRRLAGNASLRNEIGARGAETVRSLCSPEAVGAAMGERLRQISVSATR
jgi:glycosyltransferase involved in cell wall biosynthesis